ncbi:SMEK domain-containing protein [Gracilibacillus massiliensis]|uniref:SMEK domain-containing protein n=1 Tax=Gracilibacillus massiliensis TaxID=1564956 RepID=UPI00071E3BE3|nr:SMEK domain-containing protein [Gracilibacillus massiliensis]
MRRGQNQEKFIDTLTRLNQKIIMLGKINILSNHVYSENFFRDLINELYGYSLKNLNRTDQNAQAIDLIDEENKIIIQVSSTCTKQKVEQTLEKEVIKKRQLENFRVKFMFIGEQKESIKKGSYANPYSILFDPAVDILLTDDLNKEFFDKTVYEQKKILELLDMELSPILFEESYSYLSNKFIDEQVDFSISNLDSRYTKENDIDTINNKVIEAIAITDDFKSKNISYLKNIKRYMENDVKDKLETDKGIEEYDNYMKEIAHFKQLVEQFLNLDKEFENKIEVLKGVYELLDSASMSSDTFWIYESDIEDEDQKRIINFLRKIDNELLKYKEYLKETSSESLFTPYLLIQGRAGIGKSHLLGHITRRLREKNHITYLFLGQFFTENKDPWNQMLRSLDIKSSIDKFLWAIDSKAKELNKRAFIIIDALNEGEGKILWENYFQAFINRINKYSNIAFIFSIRTPFEDIVLPKGAIEKNNINIFQHQGFSEEGYEPIRSFCDYYELELPTFPVLNTEYENPLFLKLACEYYKNISKSFEQTLKISDLFNNIIGSVNISLSKAKKFDFDNNLNVVHEVINGIVELMSQSDYRELKYSDTYSIVNSIVRQYVQKPGKFLEALIDENILSKNRNYDDETIIYFSYERMGDYFLSDYLLRDYKNCSIKENKASLIDKIKSDEKISRYFKTESNLSYNQGLIEELSIKLADECDLELFEIFTEYKENDDIILSFINSLVWRAGDSITGTTKEFINENVLPFKYYRDTFLDVMLLKTSQKNHPLNAIALNRVLGHWELPIRDFAWTQYITKDNKNFFKIVNWLFDNYKKLDEESAEMYMIVLTWLFTSTNKKLRDSSTKSLVMLFREFPSLMIKALKLFQDNDDPYVVERLYASVFGGVVRSNRCEEHIEIAKYIYTEVFEKEFTYPHILMRDYARQTVEYVCLSNSILNINLDKIRPPYSSEWYSRSYTNEEIDEFVKTKKAELDNYTQNAINRIVSSMTTEHGRGTGAYGDFGRYVFGHAVKRWMNQFESDQELSNHVIMRVFKMGYEAETQGEFDLSVSPHDRHNNSVERIGKKYQWIAFHELLAKLVDNFPTFDEEKVYTKEVQDYLKENPKTTLSIIDDIDEEGSSLELEVDSSPSDLIQSKEDEEKYIEKIIKVPNQQYTGPWLDYIRDIDPTIVITKIEKGLNELIPRQLPEKPTADWVKGNAIFDDTEMFLEIEIDSEKYISLAAMFSDENSEADSSFNERDSSFFHALGYFFDKEKSDEILERRAKEYGNGINTPTAHNVFLYEHYWGEAYQDYKKDIERDSNELKVFAAHDYIWESDSSFEENALNFNIPGENIMNYFSLKQETEGIWTDSNGEKICINSKLIGFNNESLLIDKEKLCKFLGDNEYLLGWEIYMEKIAHQERHAWWYNTFYDNGKFTKIISNEEFSELD